MKPSLYLVGTPGPMGGASTKIVDFLRAFHEEFHIRVFVPDAGRSYKETKPILDRMGIVPELWSKFPSKASGVCLAVCELDFFVTGMARRVKDSGLKLVWSNEMMWEFKGEAEAVKEGLIDRVLFLSELQQAAFMPLYANVDQKLIRNFVSHSDFPFIQRTSSTFTIGRLSRDDPAKYPLDFPVFYEELGISDARFRVQAWSKELSKIYGYHKFDERWELLPPLKERPAAFLSTLDLFVYPLGHTFIESWGRTTAEAMLTGAVPLVPAGHQFHNILEHGKSGFIFNSFAECKEYAQELYRHGSLLRSMSKEASRYVREVVCRESDHRRIWMDALTF